MEKDLNVLNNGVAKIREAIEKENSKAKKKEKTLPKREEVKSVSKNPNRTLFSPESLREHNVPGYVSQQGTEELVEEIEELEI